MSDDDLKNMVEQITHIDRLVMAEYDFVYGDGSGNTQYEMSKLKVLRDRAIREWVKKLKEAFAAHTKLPQSGSKGDKV